MLQSVPMPNKRIKPTELSEEATDYLRTLNGDTDRTYRQNPIIDISIDPMTGRAPGQPLKPMTSV